MNVSSVISTIILAGMQTIHLTKSMPWNYNFLVRIFKKFWHQQTDWEIDAISEELFDMYRVYQ